MDWKRELDLSSRAMKTERERGSIRERERERLSEIEIVKSHREARERQRASID